MLAAQVYKTLRDCPKTNMTKTRRIIEKKRRRVNKRERLLIL